MTKSKPFLGVDRRIARPSPTLIILALLGTAAITFATLCPIGLRPKLGPPDEERFAAYFILGALVALAGRRRPLFSTISVVALAFALEAGQLLIPGRDARVHDALCKALGGVLGSSAVFAVFPINRLILRLYAHRRSRRTPAAQSEAL